LKSQVLPKVEIYHSSLLLLLSKDRKNFSQILKRYSEESEITENSREELNQLEEFRRYANFENLINFSLEYKSKGIICHCFSEKSP